MYALSMDDISAGDHIRIRVTMDGPANITQRPIKTGETFTYEFVAPQAGTFFYHSHDHPDRQQALGLYGALIIDPRNAQTKPAYDLEQIILLQEWLEREGLTYPAMIMEGGLPNFFTINGKSYPATETIEMKVAQRVLLRFIGSHNTTSFILCTCTEGRSVSLPSMATL